MSLFAKIMVVVNLILAVVFLAAAGTFLNATDSWRAKHKADTDRLESDKDDLQKQVEAAKAREGDANTRRESAETARAAAESRMNVLDASNEALNTQNQQLRASLDTLTATQQDLQTKNSELQTIISNLNTSLAQANSEKSDLADQVRTHLETIARLEQAVADGNAAVAAMEKQQKADAEKIDSLGTTVSLYNKAFGPLPGGPPMKPVDAVVQSVDNTNDIYILSVGSKDGVAEGWEFTVHRNGEFVATVVVDKVYANYASARTKAGMKRKDANPGDSASTSL